MAGVLRPIDREDRLKLAIERARMLAVRAARAEAKLRPVEDQPHGQGC